MAFSKPEGTTKQERRKMFFLGGGGHHCVDARARHF